VPEWLAAVVARLLAKDPRERFQSAAELAALLRRHLACLRQPGLAPPITATDGSKPRRRNRWRAVGVLVGLVAVAACLGPVALRRRPGGNDKKPPPAPLDPGVLTVSKDSRDGARFTTIQDALRETKPGMIVRVLDAAYYDEYLLIDNEDY